MRTLAAFALLWWVIAFARFLDNDELENNVCHSSASGVLAKVRVSTTPLAAVDLLEVNSVKKYEITCLSVYEDGPDLLPSQQDLCKDPPKLFLCKSPVLEDGEKMWECEPILQYIENPRSSITIGGWDKDPQHMKIQWMPTSMGPVCFPRDLTVQMVGFEVQQPKTDKIATVCFIILVCGVGALVVIFATYQLRKQMAKFWKRDVMAAKKEPQKDAKKEAMKALAGSPYGDPRTFRAAKLDDYDESEVIPTKGQQSAVIDEGNVVVVSQPMPKPWYDRYGLQSPIQNRPFGGPLTPEHISRTATKSPGTAGKNFGSPAPKAGKRTPVRQSDSHTKAVNIGSAAKYNPQMYEDDEATAEEEEEYVLTCQDCMLPIKDPNTPQYCQVSGKRHF